MEKETESPPSSIKKRRCGYKKDWENEYLWLKGVEGDTERAFCDLCKTSFSIRHGGEYDVKRHRLTETHKKRVQQKETYKSMDAFLRPKNDFLADKVTAAEVTSVSHTFQHATSYRAGDCGTKLAPTIYPDLDIAKRMACGRTKAEAIVTDVLAPASVEDCLKVLRRPLNEQREATTKGHRAIWSSSRGEVGHLTQAHTHTKHDSISFFPLECTNHQCFSGEGLFTDDRMLDGHKEQMFGKPHQVRNPGEEQLHIQLQGLLHLCSEDAGEKV